MLSGRQSLQFCLQAAIVVVVQNSISSAQKDFTSTVNSFSHNCLACSFCQLVCMASSSWGFQMLHALGVVIGYRLKSRHMQETFVCGNYRRKVASCTTHFIRTRGTGGNGVGQPEAGALYANGHANTFRHYVLQRAEQEQKQALREQHRELDKAERNIAELDVFFIFIGTLDALEGKEKAESALLSAFFLVKP